MPLERFFNDGLQRFGITANNVRNFIRVEREQPETVIEEPVINAILEEATITPTEEEPTATPTVEETTTDIPIEEPATSTEPSAEPSV